MGIRCVKKDQCLYRVYTDTDIVSIKDDITVVGQYCFAPDPHASRWDLSQEERAASIEAPANMRAACGDYVAEISLPDTVTEIDAYAFYQCKNLRRLTLGKNLRKISGDAFINCRSLKEIVVKGQPNEASGLKQILSLLSNEVEVTFENDGKIEAKLVFPEYLETYEEVGPAHLFHMEVEGEGYRARLLFENDIFQFKAYDKVFATSVHQERFMTLMKMAMDRLTYPFELEQSSREMYEQYIKENQIKTMTKVVENRDEDYMQRLVASGLIDKDGIAAAISEAARGGWARGSYLIIKNANEAAR